MKRRSFLWFGAGENVEGGGENEGWVRVHPCTQTGQASISLRIPRGEDSKQGREGGGVGGGGGGGGGQEVIAQILE